MTKEREIDNTFGLFVASLIRQVGASFIVVGPAAAPDDFVESGFRAGRVTPGANAVKCCKSYVRTSRCTIPRHCWPYVGIVDAGIVFTATIYAW